MKRQMFTANLIRMQLKKTADELPDIPIGIEFDIWGKHFKVIKGSLIDYQYYYFCEQIENTSPILWFVTFGSEHLDNSGLGRYTIVKAETEEEARKKIFSIFGKEWAFIYPSAELAGISKWKLDYISIEDAEKLI